MTGVKVLLIEARKVNTRSYSVDLLKSNHLVQVEHSASKAVDKIRKFAPDIIVLDAASMRTSGTRLSHRLHKSCKNCKIILVVGENTQLTHKPYIDIVLIRPFTSRKLLNAVKRLAPLPAGTWRELGPLKLSIKQRRVQCWDKEKRLTPKEAKLLQVLANRAGSTVSRKHLIKQVWETDYLGDTRTLDVHISWLRRAIEKDPLDPRLLKTVRGKGYRLDVSNTNNKHGV
jgi:DNA-binding response OmpR family regulator